MCYSIHYKWADGHNQTKCTGSPSGPALLLPSHARTRVLAFLANRCRKYKTTTRTIHIHGINNLPSINPYCSDNSIVHWLAPVASWTIKTGLNGNMFPQLLVSTVLDIPHVPFVCSISIFQIPAFNSSTKRSNSFVSVSGDHTQYEPDVSNSPYTAKNVLPMTYIHLNIW